MCASWMDTAHKAETFNKAMTEIAEAIASSIQAERDRTIEECAKVAEDIREDYLPQHSLETRSACREISTAIRSLSKGRGI